MFFAALAQVHPGLEPHEGDGFVIITAASDQGMVDIHDRRPLVLAPEHAREWIDPELSPARAEDIAKNLCLPVEAFEWYPVGTAVGKESRSRADTAHRVMGNLPPPLPSGSNLSSRGNAQNLAVGCAEKIRWTEGRLFFVGL